MRLRQRRYSPDVVARIGFIRRAQQLGFSLARLQEMRDRLGSLIAASRKAGGRDACPIIVALNTPD